MLQQKGFNVSVESIWGHLSGFNFISRFRERLRLSRLIKKIGDELKVQGVTAQNWDRSQVEPQCSIIIARFGVLEPLKDYINTELATSVKTNIHHLFHIREWHSYFIPVDFAKPLGVRLNNRDGVIPVGSSIKLKKELLLLNKILRVEKSFDITKMVSHMYVKEEDILNLESDYVNPTSFWVNFGFVILSKLAESSVNSGLPIIFH